MREDVLDVADGASEGNWRKIWSLDAQSLHETIYALLLHKLIDDLILF